MPSMKRIPGLAHRTCFCLRLLSQNTPHKPIHTHTYALLELLNHQSGVCSNLHLCVCVYERWYGGRVSLWQVEDCGKLQKKQQCFPAPTRLSLTRLFKLLMLLYPFTFPLLSGSVTFGSCLVKNDLFSAAEPISILSLLCGTLTFVFTLPGNVRTTQQFVVRGNFSCLSQSLILHCKIISNHYLFYFQFKKDVILLEDVKWMLLSQNVSWM